MDMGGNGDRDWHAAFLASEAGLLPTEALICGPAEQEMISIA